METAYWKTFGEVIVKKLGPKVGNTGRILGRIAIFGTITWGIYEFVSNFDKNKKNEPIFQEMLKYETEFEKWNSIIGCIGREPYAKGSLGSVNEGGCINALSKKKTLKLYSSEAQSLIMPDTELAKDLLEIAICYVKQTENLVGYEDFEEQKEDLAKRINDLKDKVESFDYNTDYSPIQQDLSEIVRNIIPVESAYRTKIYDCQVALQKTMPRNAAWALASSLTFGLVKKKVPKKE